MVNERMRVVVKIERDAQNFFFARMLYGFDNSENELQTIYSIKDENLIDNIIALSYMALNASKTEKNAEESGIIVYNIESKCCFHGYYTDYTAPNQIIVGTVPTKYFRDINDLIKILSKTLKKEKLGDISVMYKDQKMTEKEFFKFQRELSIDPAFWKF